ncbi:MAG: hypothetical protein KC549_06090 [Myxococcales bacterium]|nr:hypothetical protein [Myxococcales bacterium]
MNTLGLLCLALLASPTVAPQAPEPPGPVVSDADRARAQALYEEGVGYFKGQAYPVAMDKFAAAYALDPSPILLYNLARAAEESGEADAAVEHYRAYLEKFSNAEDRPEVERRIRILTAVLRNAKRGSIAVVEVPASASILINDKPAGAPDEEGVYRRDPGTYALKVVSEAGIFTTDVEVKAGEVTTVTWSSPPVEPDGSLAIAGWSTVGTGALLTGAAFIFYAEAHDAADVWNDSVDRIQAGDTTPQALARKRQAKADVESNSETAITLWALGGAVMATGVGLLVYEALSEDPVPAVSLVVLPGGAGVSGRF